MLSLFASLFAIAHAQPAAAAAPLDKQKAAKHVKYEFMGQMSRTTGAGRERDTGALTRAPRCHSTATHRLHSLLLLVAVWLLTAGPPGTICDLHCQQCWPSWLIEANAS